MDLFLSSTVHLKPTFFLFWCIKIPNFLDYMHLITTTCEYYILHFFISLIHFLLTFLIKYVAASACATIHRIAVTNFLDAKSRTVSNIGLILFRFCIWSELNWTSLLVEGPLLSGSQVSRVSMYLLLRPNEASTLILTKCARKKDKY